MYRINRKTFWIIFGLAAALRAFNIWRAPLWYDENFTLLLARLPFDRMLDATAGDVHPPLWYVIEWLIYHAAPGLPAWVIRVPALICSMLALVVFERLMRTMELPTAVQIGALVLMAVMPMQLWYAQEGRMYALLELLVLVNLYCVIMRKWTGVEISAAAMLYTQNYAVFYLAVICLFNIIDYTRWYRNFNHWSWRSPLTILRAARIEAFAFAGIIYLPWVKVIADQMTEIHGRYWIMDVGPGSVLADLYRQFWASAMPQQIVIPSYAVTFAVLILGVAFMIRDRAGGLVLVMAFAPVLIAWGISAIWQPVLLFRPLIGISPFLYIIAAWPLSSLLAVAAAKTSNGIPTPKTVVLQKPALYAACFLAPLFIAGIGGYYLNIAAIKGEGAVSPLLDAFAYVRSHWQDGDVLYYADDGPMVNLMPYTNGLPEYKMPACAERVGSGPVLGSLSDSTRRALGIQIADLADVPHKRAWVFAPRSPLHPLCYEDQIAPLTTGDPVIVVDDNEYITSAIWLTGDEE